MMHNWKFAVLLALTLGGAATIFVFLNRNNQTEENELLAETKTAGFDGDRAIQYLDLLCKIGPRISGSDGMKAQQKLLKDHFEKFGAVVTFQKFDASQRSKVEKVEMTNMIISWYPEMKKRILICGHYDTRPIADQEPKKRDWYKPFVSANDGTSTVAFMMEMAHSMKDLKPNVGVDFILFDGEEYIHNPVIDNYFFGSEYFANDYTKNPPKHVYVAGVLLDLFAANGATFRPEQNSKFLAGKVLEDLWNIAAELKIPRFEDGKGDNVSDDHIALNRAKIPTVDIIDLQYEHWHRLSDTPDKCSPSAMTDVAKVIIEWLKRLK